MHTEQSTEGLRAGRRSYRTATAAAAAALAVVAATAIGGGSANAAPANSTRADFDYIGEFATLKTAPEGTPEIKGQASMVATTRSTTTAIVAMTGLDPKNTYIADVHDQACFLGDGGNRFLFDPNGSKGPPNAIWLTPIKFDANGQGAATTTSHDHAGIRAKSIVLHLLRPAGADKDEANPPRLACADLVRVTS